MQVFRRPALPSSLMPASRTSSLSGPGRTTTASRAALLDHLAWESRRHRLDPIGSSTYVNPVSGDERVVGNISGHLDWAATECPGAVLYADLMRANNIATDTLLSVSPGTLPGMLSLPDMYEMELAAGTDRDLN